MGTYFMYCGYLIPFWKNRSVTIGKPVIILFSTDSRLVAICLLIMKFFLAPSSSKTTFKICILFQILKTLCR